jgi:copper homeostasis protein
MLVLRMPVPFLLEIAVESVEAALAAERGGAHRIELCATLDNGGTTPPIELQRETCSVLRIPVHLLIRPRPGDFVYSKSELQSMKLQIDAAKQLGVNGVVLGVLKPNGSVDIEATQELVRHADPLPVTFHRAFDETPDLLQALEEVCSAGAKRILTSGGAKDAITGIAMLQRLQATAGDRIVVMPGGGIRSENVLELLRATGAPEIHSGLGTVLKYGSADIPKFESEVRKLATIV